MSTATPTLAGTWAVDPANSKVGFAVKQMGIATVRGEFTEFEGILDLASATVQGTVIAASVDTNEPRRDEHLRSPDCFDVERHPELAFRSTSVEPVDETTFRILGELTLHGVTNEVELTAEVRATESDPWDNERIGLGVTGVISRADYGMRFNWAPVNRLVGDKVQIALEISAVRQA
jgi:polyisoprenoid-binding protein YceI